MKIDDKTDFTCLGVFDGHGGSECATYVKLCLHRNLKAYLEDEIDGI
jgi:serine/threonine protein phosphatase PrpC